VCLFCVCPSICLFVSSPVASFVSSLRLSIHLFFYAGNGKLIKSV
jgi:hypothetical protein